ncbi:hypothetical protein Leryth_000471 [Lithospermum erythrorhizon]|nr:hypothetical protein Leryth_000471 [Lithospermum erythrorhizon]
MFGCSSQLKCISKWMSKHNVDTLKWKRMQKKEILLPYWIMLTQVEPTMQKKKTVVFPLSQKNGSFLVEPGAFGCIEADKCTTPNHISLIENINVSTPAFLAQPDGSVMKVGQMDDPVSIGGAHIDDLSRSNKQAVVEIKTLVKDDILDDLDHVVLISRQRMLLQKESKSASNVQEISFSMST